MTRFALLFGGIAGGLICLNFIWSAFAVRSAEPGAYGSEWVGYLVMFVALSSIFIGVKRYRDLELGGVIRFGQALQLGLMITLVASALYVVGWEIHLALTDHAFIGNYTQGVIEARRAAGLAGVELEALVAEMEEMKVNYAKPFFRMPMTFLEIFPVGVLISLVSALLLRRSELLPARATA